jgi:hypothetical protein
MMKRATLWAFAAAVALLPTLALAQQAEPRYTAMSGYDLDGEAADADQIVTVVALTDNLVGVIAAQPDTCRLVDATLVDADSSLTGGALTVVGTDCLNLPKSCSYTFVGDGSAIVSLTCTDGESAYFKTVTSVGTGALTGEGGADTITVGYTSNSAIGWPMYGRLAPTGPSGEHGVDPYGSYPVSRLITTSAALSTTVTGVVAADDPFDLVSVGDLLVFSVSGTLYERRVTAKASADSITVNQAVNIPAAGVTFSYRKLYFSTNPADRMAYPVGGYQSIAFDWAVDYTSSTTAGLILRIECAPYTPEYNAARWTKISEIRLAGSAPTQADSRQIVSTEGYGYCRFGAYYATGDDIDGSAEDINLTVTLSSTHAGQNVFTLPAVYSNTYSTSDVNTEVQFGKSCYSVVIDNAGANEVYFNPTSGTAAATSGGANIKVLASKTYGYSLPIDPSGTNRAGMTAIGLINSAGETSVGVEVAAQCWP